LHVILHSQERFLEGLLEELRTPRCSDDVYPSTAKVNASLLRVAASTLHIPEDKAAFKIQQKLMLPMRQPAKGIAHGHLSVHQARGGPPELIADVNRHGCLRQTHAHAEGHG